MGGNEIKELMIEKKATIKSNLILTFRNYGYEEKMHSGVKVFIQPDRLLITKEKHGITSSMDRTKSVWSSIKMFGGLYGSSKGPTGKTAVRRPSG